MNEKKRVGLIRSAFTALKYNRVSDAKGTPLRMQLFAFFMFFTIFIIASFLLILLGLGVTVKGTPKLREHMDSTLSLLSDQIYDELNTLSVQGLNMSDKLSADIDNYLHSESISASQLQQHPEIIEPLLSRQAAYLLNTLEYSKCSGAFILLDATVNPTLENAESSKAGILINRTVPNVIGYNGTELHYLRGPASIARTNNIELLGQWKMEFDTVGQSYWFDVMETARQNPDLELSRLYYWTEKVVMKDNSETAMFLIIPLRSAEGDVYGVCGLQYSSMFFKYQYSPDNSKYTKIFSVLAPFSEASGQTVDFNGSLIAGNSYLTGTSIDTQATISHNDNGFDIFNCDNDISYGGLSHTIRIYPSNSPYAELNPVYCLLMPKEDLDSAITGNSIYLYIFIIILLLVSFLVSLFISNRYIRPLTEAFKNIKSQNYAMLQNKYFEINDLMEFLATRDNEQEAKAPESGALKVIENTVSAESEPDATQTAPAIQDNSTLFDSFMTNINTLSTAEMAVFNLYLEGYTAKEISELLCLSINTIKTHNRRIFAKLNVSGRNELMVYINMMKEKEAREKNTGQIKRII